MRALGSAMDHGYNPHRRRTKKMKFPQRGGYHPPTDLVLEKCPKQRNIMSKGHNMMGKHVVDDKSLIIFMIKPT